METGEIVFSKIVSGREILGKMPVPSYDALIGGIKKAAAKGLEDCRPELSRWFTVKGYILQTRSSADGAERSALINIGEKQGLKGGGRSSSSIPSRRSPTPSMSPRNPAT